MGVNVNGKPEVNASASVNVERNADGKSASQKASVNVNSNTGFSNQSSTSKSTEHANFIAEDAVLRKGIVELSGYFTNDGSEPI